MPIYEYVCNTCGITFEKIVKMSEADSVVKNNCSSPLSCDIKRIFSVSSVHFKGSGFYETDYKKK